MDPLSITTSATAMLAICLQAVHLIQKTIETVKNARKLLARLLSHTERLRLILEQLRSLTKQLGPRGGLLVSYNDSGPKITIREVNDLVKSIADKTNFVGFQVLMNKGKVDELVRKLKTHEEEVVTVLLSIATGSAVRTENEVHQMHEESKAQSEVLHLFEDYFIGGNENSPKNFQPKRELQIWWGDTYRNGFDDKYLDLRDRLSNAAYEGNFKEMFEVLDVARNLYGQSWINAPRLSSDPRYTSGWTSLHQAVFNGAPHHVVEALLDMEASRTLRTNWTDASEFSYRDLCALEIAHEHGHAHLFDILAPVIKIAVPGSALAAVQERFHQLIREDLSPFRNQEHLRLPELTVLTEMTVPEMWFPLKSIATESPSLRGYLYHLDGRELVVQVIAIRNSEDLRLFRISASETREIVDGIAFNSTSRTG